MCHHSELLDRTNTKSGQTLKPFYRHSVFCIPDQSVIPIKEGRVNEDKT